MFFSSPNSIWRQWIRLFALSLGFTFIFTNFSALQNLESSLFEQHPDPSIGSKTIAILYAFATVGSTMSPMVLQVVGTKWCLVLGTIGHALFTAAHYCSSYATLFPASAWRGFSTGLVWTAQGKSVMHFAEDYVTMKSTQLNSVVSLFNGIFYSCYLSAQIWGNAISSFILKINANENDSSIRDGFTCGANFCPSKVAKPDPNLANDTKVVKNSSSVSATVCVVPDAQVQMVFGIFLCCVAIGFLLFLSLPNLSRLSKEQRAKSNCKSVAMAMVGGLVFTAQDLKAFLLTPLFFYTGFQQATLMGNFNQAFVTCRFGIQTVGFVMLTYGVCDTVASVIAGRLAKFAGQSGILLVGIVIQATLLLLMQFKTPSSSELWLLHLISGLWGVADACWHTQTAAMVGLLFSVRQEMAFASFKLWQNAGFGTAFGISPALCTGVSLWIGLALLALSSAGLTAVEILKRRKKKMVLPEENENRGKENENRGKKIEQTKVEIQDA